MGERDPSINVKVDNEPSESNEVTPTDPEQHVNQVEYKKHDYRGFIFVVHAKYGLMLLYCSRKKSKPPHYQLPGGHIDLPEFVEAGTSRSISSWASNIRC